jgi:sugar phosphate isomerase/epimerase
LKTAVSRRQCLQLLAGSVPLAGATGVFSRTMAANPLGMPIGCQTYPVRKMIERDFPGTIRQLAAAGFQAIELCSPAGYADSGFGGLAKYSGGELRKLLDSLHVQCQSCHFDIEELRKDLPGRITWARELGLIQMMVPSLDGPKHPVMGDVKKAADEYNKMGEQTAAAGIQLGLHNEDFEMTSVDGKRTYDLLFGLLDPKLVKFQFQVSTISAGYDAIEYFTKYPGRFVSMHVQGWDAKTRKIVAVGQGTLNWPKIFAAAKTGGIRNYFVEMNLPLMEASVPYLKQLQV